MRPRRLVRLPRLFHPRRMTVRPGRTHCGSESRIFDALPRDRRCGRSFALPKSRYARLETGRRSGPAQCVRSPCHLSRRRVLGWGRGGHQRILQRANSTPPSGWYRSGEPALLLGGGAGASPTTAAFPQRHSRPPKLSANAPSKRLIVCSTGCALLCLRPHPSADPPRRAPVELRGTVPPDRRT